jgi:hypothetical protein
MEERFEIVDRRDHCAAKGGFPAQGTFLHRAGHPLHCIRVRTSWATAQKQSVELFDVIAGFEYEKLEKSWPFAHARSMGLRVTKLGRPPSGVHGGTQLANGIRESDEHPSTDD